MHTRDADSSRQEAAALAADAEKLRAELQRAQAASRQLAAGGQAEAVRTAGESERLERELAAARSAHSRAVEGGKQVRGTPCAYNER